MGTEPPGDRSPVEPGEEPLSLDDRHRWWKEAGGWQLRQLLFWRWDPIGVSNAFPYTRDEYDGYAGGLEKLLTDAADPDHLSVYLLAAEQRMGLGTSHEADARRAEIAELILTWRRNSLSHWRSQLR